MSSELPFTPPTPTLDRDGFRIAPANLSVEAMERDYDVVIVRSSFASLSAASQLHGDILFLLDRNDPGAHQTSACSAPHDLIRELDRGEAVLRALDTVTVDVNGERAKISLSRPYCTLDYRRFCQILFEAR